MALEIAREGDVEAARRLLRAYFLALLAVAQEYEAGFWSALGIEPTDSRAQAGGNLSGLIIGITIAAVIGVAVAIPVINDVVSSSNASGTTLTVLDLLDLFVSLLILVAIASPLMNRT